MTWEHANWECRDLQELESTLMDLLQDSRDPRMQNCAPVKGYYLVQWPEHSRWSAKHGYEISGLTYCPERIMEFNTDSPFATALPHEYIHALQDCKPLEAGTDDKMHDNWEVDGLNDVVRAMTDIGIERRNK